MRRQYLVHAPIRRKMIALYAVLITGAIMAGLQAASAAPPGGEFPSKVPVPADNPMTPRKIYLGKQLYFDPRLSLSGDVSCDTCHNVAGNGSDGLPLSFGVLGRVDRPRHAPTVFNSAFNTVQFWDGRAKSLEDQAKGPLLNPIEMGMPSSGAIVKRLAGIPGYRREFARVFGGKTPITFEHVVQAIATYERTLVTPDSPYDRYLKGDKNALDKSAKQGMHEVSDLGCASCHAGAMFDNPGLPMGTGWFRKFPMIPTNPTCATYVREYHLADDPGRFDVTHKQSDEHVFKVPSLRNVAVLAPYFQNGSVGSLRTAVRVMAACQLGKTLTGLQTTNIVAFLNSLTGKFPVETMPHLPETPDSTSMMQVAKLQQNQRQLN